MTTPTQRTDEEREQAFFFHTYHRLPLQIERGEGVTLIDKNGRHYLDFFAGLAVNALGYGNPAVLGAIRKQSEAYCHLSNYFLQTPQVDLAEELLRQAGKPYTRVFFSNSGTEAVEGAIKIARRWGVAKGKNELIATRNAFHGRTLGALSLMDRQNYREGFGPFLPGCHSVSTTDVSELREVVSDRTAAVILEFIQGEGGVIPVNKDFAAEIESLRKQYGFLLIADEIQAGVGRTGKFFGFEHYDGIIGKPDIVVAAKALGGGLPLGAIIGTDTVTSVLQPGAHGTTFGGNPVSCAAGKAVLDEIRDRNLIEHAASMGKLLLDGFAKLQKKYPSLIREVRGMGLMLGIDLKRDAAPVVDAMRERGILINGTNTTVLRFLPPLTITPEHVNHVLTTLDAVMAGL
jgi:acetylornithine/N-succinyldiaminopimelate aminotransferase